jgi:hypothetical protein
MCSWWVGELFINQSGAYFYLVDRAESPYHSASFKKYYKLLFVQNTDSVVDSRVASRSQPGQYYHARYHASDDNIFLQIQKRHIPDFPTDESAMAISSIQPNLLPLYQQLGVPEWQTIPEVESRYLHYLTRELPANIGAGEMFPSVFGTIFARSMSNDALRYLMLAVSSFLADNRSHRPSLYAFKYLQMGIPQIQQALTDGEIDDALIYAVFFAAFLHLACGELASMRRHLEGLHLLLQRYQVGHGDLQPTRNAPDELMFIWRMAIRMDHMWAIADQECIFPLVAQQDDLHRPWIRRLVGYSRPEMVEWALAHFALDDLLTRSISISKKATQLRSVNGNDKDIAEAAIRLETTKLLNEHQNWTSRSCVKAAADLAATEQQIYDELGFPDINATPFLHYPALKITDKLYGALLIQYHWVWIYITFITRPETCPSSIERFQAAIELCRIYASVGWTKIVGVCRMILGLYLAGLTFGEPMYPTGIMIWSQD